MSLNIQSMKHGILQNLDLPSTFHTVLLEKESLQVEERRKKRQSDTVRVSKTMTDWDVERNERKVKLSQLFVLMPFYEMRDNLLPMIVNPLLMMYEICPISHFLSGPH